VRIATWNVNSLKVRLPHLLDWLARQRPDVICLQETKLEDQTFPTRELDAVGYCCALAGQRTHNGVAIISRTALTSIQTGIPSFEDDQKRVVAASVSDIRIVSAYAPNGQAVGTDRYEYKIRWFRAFTDWLCGELDRFSKLVVVGDFNVAPEDRDVYDPTLWQGQVLCSEAERAAFHRLLDLGLRDAFRLFEQRERSFTWWDYRLGAFRRNLGLRIDHILVSPAVVSLCANCRIDVEPRKLERPSDHAPVILDLRV
jgi:exodeoxyribonuclease III